MSQVYQIYVSQLFSLILWLAFSLNGVFFLFVSFGCIRSQLWHAGCLLRHVDSSLQCVGFSLVVVCRFSLSSCGLRAPGHVGSVVCSTWALSLRRTSSEVVERGYSCPVAREILVPRPGIEPMSPAFLTTGPPGKSRHDFF